MPEFRDIVNFFAELRYEAEQNARKFSTGKEVSIEEIYHALSLRCHINTEGQNKLIRLEVKTEIECALPIAENIQILKEKIDQGEQVILVSDMYLSERYIREILLSVDGIFANVPIYVSCDFGETKAGGLLYARIADKEHVEYCDWVHYGDNVISDKNVAELYGINSVLVKRYRGSVIEASLGGYFHTDDNYDVQMTLGMVRDLCFNHDEYAYKLGVLCGGSILYPYVKWILDESKYDGIKKLLFMSRDGYLLKKIADIIISKEFLDMETEYIYVSKNVLRDTGDIGERAAEYIKGLIGERDDIAFVDFQGTGNSVVCLAKKLDQKLRAFYYILNGSPQRDGVELSCFTYVPIKSGMVEIFCRAPHGAVYDYQICGENEIKPLTAYVDDKVWIECGLYDYISGAEAFAGYYTDHLKSDLPEIDLEKIARFLIRYCENNPDKDTAAFIGDFPHGEENADELSCFAPVLDQKSLERIYSERKNESIDGYYKGSNIEYSMMRSGISRASYLLENFRTMKNRKDAVNGQRIVIYAAGKYGYEAWYRVNRSDDKTVVAWVDMNYQSLNNDLLVSPSVIREVEYDLILVCLNKEKQFKTVRDMLVSTGVDYAKIVWICDYWKGFFI